MVEKIKKKKINQKIEEYRRNSKEKFNKKPNGGKIWRKKRPNNLKILNKFKGKIYYEKLKD